MASAAKAAGLESSRELLIAEGIPVDGAGPPGRCGAIIWGAAMIHSPTMTRAPDRDAFVRLPCSQSRRNSTRAGGPAGLLPVAAGAYARFGPRSGNCAACRSRRLTVPLANRALFRGDARQRRPPGMPGLDQLGKVPARTHASAICGWLLHSRPLPAARQTEAGSRSAGGEHQPWNCQTGGLAAAGAGGEWCLRAFLRPP